MAQKYGSMVPQLRWPVTSRGSKGKQESWNLTWHTRQTATKAEIFLATTFELQSKLQKNSNNNEQKPTKKEKEKLLIILRHKDSQRECFTTFYFEFLFDIRWICVYQHAYWNQQRDQINQPLEIGTSYTVKIVKQMYWDKLGVSREEGGPGWDREMGMQKASIAEARRTIRTYNWVKIDILPTFWKLWSQELE